MDRAATDARRRFLGEFQDLRMNLPTWLAEGRARLVRSQLPPAPLEPPPSAPASGLPENATIHSLGDVALAEGLADDEDEDEFGC